MILVDASAWVALFLPGDSHHHSAQLEWDRLRASNESLVTTDHLIDETLTVMERRLERGSAIQAGEFILSSAVVNRLPITEQMFEAAWALYRSPEGAGLSFTDCTSVAAMRAAGTSAIFTFDRGFRKAGLRTRP